MPHIYKTIDTFSRTPTHRTEKTQEWREEEEKNEMGVQTRGGIESNKIKKPLCRYTVHRLDEFIKTKLVYKTTQNITALNPEYIHVNAHTHCIMFSLMYKWIQHSDGFNAMP